MAESRSTPGSDVYTVLVFIALLALIVGVVYVWYRSGQLYGSWNPFSFEVRSAGSAVASLIRG